MFVFRLGGGGALIREPGLRSDKWEESNLELDEISWKHCSSRNGKVLNPLLDLIEHLTVYIHLEIATADNQV